MSSIDPSNLHLKKEFTQIRKAARVLKDPGTSSSYRSPISSNTPLTKHHYVHHQKNSPSIDEKGGNGNNAAKDSENSRVKNKEGRVFLYNWKSQKPDICEDEGSSSSNREESAEVGNLSDSRGGVGNYSTDSYASALFKCKDAGFTPSIRRSVKKKTKRGNNYAGSRNHSEKLTKSYDFANRVDHSDNTEEYCNSTISPLLAKLKNNSRWSSSPKMLLKTRRKEDDSISYSTPALSTSSCNKYGFKKNPSTLQSWDGTTGSVNDADDEVDERLDFPGRNGCGIPCYWSKRSTPRKGFSPTFSDTLRRGSSILCGSQRKHHRTSFPPLLTRGESSSDEEISEMDLEGLSRLDGKRWSLSREEEENQDSPENIRSLSHKYRPIFFDEIVGQEIVVGAITSAISRKRISPVYLFQGPRGTGKTSTARILASALNCLSNDETKPCGVCRECADFISGRNTFFREIDGSSQKGFDKIKNKKTSQYQVIVVDECHLLPSTTWQAFLQLLEKPPPRTVFVLITTDVDNVPRTVLSRCQKHIFSKIGNGDIVTRLRKIASDENLDVESEALESIASNSDGSLRDAETMLDQLSLFGKRISMSLVNELIGVVSDETLLDLLELAMSSNVTETVRKARELMDSGVDPIALMSQMATLIVDIIAGTYQSVDRHGDSFLGGRNLSERELNRLKHALTLLSEAEKQLRVSSDRSTWFTATLLQIGSFHSPNRSFSGSSRGKSSKATEEDNISVQQRFDSRILPEKSQSPKNPNQIRYISGGASSNLHEINSKGLIDLWAQCIEKCHSKTLQQLLHSYGKLVSITEVKGGFVAHIAFSDNTIKTRAEGFLSSITNSFEIVLRRNVEVKIILLPDSISQNHMDKRIPENKSTRSNINNLNLDLLNETVNKLKGGFNLETSESISGNTNTSTSDNPGRRIQSIIDEQRLETAWLQAMEKGTPRSLSRLKPERNQILPQDGPNRSEPSNSLEDELNHEIKALKINDSSQKDERVKRIDHCPISPSLLHHSNFSKDNMGYESGSAAGGCSGMFCWNNNGTHKKKKAKTGTSIRVRQTGRFSWFGECAKSRRKENRYNR